MATNIGPIMNWTLTQYGLGGLAGWVSKRITEGATLEELEIEVFERPEFKAAFPEIEARRKAAAAGGLIFAQISPQEILAYRASARALMRGYGLPETFYAKDSNFFELIVNDVSIEELNQRLDQSVTRVHQAPPEVRQVFNELFGTMSDTALFSIFVDPDRALPELEKMVLQAEAGGAGRRFGFNLDTPAIERMAGYGVNYGTAVEGFSQLDLRRGLFEETLFETEDFKVEEEGIEAVFGLEGGANEKLQRRAETRTAQTSGQSGGATESYGAAGLGGAGRR